MRPYYGFNSELQFLNLPVKPNLKVITQEIHKPKFIYDFFHHWLRSVPVKQSFLFISVLI